MHLYKKEEKKSKPLIDNKNFRAIRGNLGRNNLFQ